MAESVQPLKRFGLTSMFWLPLTFYIWFSWSSVLLVPVAWLVDALLSGVFDSTFHAVVQSGRSFAFEVYALSPDGRQAVISFAVNPLIYGYGLPLLIGMIMAVPQSSGRQIGLMGLGCLLLMVVWVWGVSFDALKTLLFDLPDQVQGLAVQKPAINRELVALCYQFGYLILPGVVPVVFWLGTHRPFIEQITGRKLGSSQQAEQEGA
jgi:hypothetical protein